MRKQYKYNDSEKYDIINNNEPPRQDYLNIKLHVFARDFLLFFVVILSRLERN